MKAEDLLADSTVLMQLYDNIVYQVGSQGSVPHLPVIDSGRKYHVEGTLLVAEKMDIRELTA